jgi:hypothetical protein
MRNDHPSLVVLLKLNGLPIGFSKHRLRKKEGKTSCLRERRGEFGCTSRLSVIVKEQKEAAFKYQIDINIHNTSII